MSVTKMPAARVAQLSSWARYVVIALAFLIPAGGGLSLLGGSTFVANPFMEGSGAGMFVVVPRLALVIMILFQYERLFRLFERGMVFVPSTGMWIRRAGQSLLAFGFSGPVLAVVLLALGRADLASRELGAIMVGPVLYGMSNIIIGHVMVMAHSVSEEARMTI